MAQSRFFSQKAKKDYVVFSVPAVEVGHVNGLQVSKDYTYTPDLEEFMKKYKDGAVNGVHMKIIEAAKSHTGKQQIHLVLPPHANLDFSATEKEFRTAAAKLGYIRGHQSIDDEEITKAFDTYLQTENIKAHHKVRVHLNPQHGGGGNAC